MATTTHRDRQAEPAPAQGIPPLRNGDRLTADEFERRYEAMPLLRKAELIEGRVFLPSPDFTFPDQDGADVSSPVSFRKHASPHFKVISWMGQYASLTPGLEGGDNGSLRLDLNNRPQPDAFLIVLPEFGGQARISPDDYVEGAPELVVEVAYSSVSYDLHDKLDAYRRNQVAEYVVWKVEDAGIDWFVLREGRFVQLAPGPDGLLRSEVFPGLWLDPAALIRGDMATVLRVAQAGVASPEHAAFVARLQQRAGGARP